MESVKYVLLSFNRFKLILGLILILVLNVKGQNKYVTVKGHVEDANSGIHLTGVNVSVLKTHLGTTTDSLGNYILNLNTGKYSITFSCVGYKTITKKININGRQSNFNVDVSLKPNIYVMKDVTVNANKVSDNLTLDTLKAKDLQNIPNVFSNILSSIKFLPGVTSNNELSSTYNVRGGNYNENLIYLNGFEIYQPYLIQEGIEESQSIVNENMVSSMEFYHGAFPVSFGDKMSSALAINYYTQESPELGGEINADLFNMGLTLHDKTGNFNWRTGIRYAYPYLFDKALIQTKGQYKPSFDDFQFTGSYDLPNKSQLQLLFLTARNYFDLTPQRWFGNFQTAPFVVKQVTLNFNGQNSYNYKTNLAGLKFLTPLSENSNLSTSISYYSDKELYSKNLSYDVYYSDDGYHPYENMQYIETGNEFADNYLNMRRLEFKADYNLKYNIHNISVGTTFRYSKMESSLNDSTYFTGADSVLNFSGISNQKLNVNFNSIAAYIEDNIFLSSRLNANAGLRVLKYYFNNQLLFSPRVSITYKPDPLNSFYFAWGYYFQPPYFYETWDKNINTAKSLLAQEDIQYNLNWENHFRKNAKFTVELFYKDIRHMIPYYIKDLNLIYGDKNNYKGFAYGFDLQYEGELSQNLETWIGYSYLNAEEKETPGNFPYVKSPFGQSHTIRIFLQDGAKKHKNFQVHVLFLFGTGYYYNPMKSVPGPTSGSYQIVPDYNVTEVYPFFMRVDMGLTFKFNILKQKEIIFTADVLNIFNNYNITSYSWYHVLPQVTQPVPVANILSPRFFNVGFKFNF